MHTLVVYGKRRARHGWKKRYGWRMVAPNGNIVATDGRQDYNHRTDAAAIARLLFDGEVDYELGYDLSAGETQ